MLYDLGYRARLEPNTTEQSDEITIISESGISSVSVVGATLIVNGVPLGNSANVTDGDTVSIEATSGASLGVPRFIQFIQDNKVEGTFCLINRFDVTFEYNDALNGKYAWEVLDTSVWVPTDNSSLGVYSNEELTLVPFTDTPVDSDSIGAVRNKVHVLDYYMNHINVVDTFGNFLGRVPDVDYEGPTDSATVYKSGSESRMMTAFAFDKSSKVTFYSNSYVLQSEIDVADPIALTSVLNVLYVASRNSNTITIVTFNDDQTVASTETVTLSKKPHRLYQIGSYCAVLTESSIEFILGNALDHSLTLPQFASSLDYDPIGGTLYISHRQERTVTKVNLDFDNGHTIDETAYFITQGYLDAIVYSRSEDLIYVSDVVEKEIIILDTDLNMVDSIDLGDNHSYEMFMASDASTLVLSCLYPDIDERLIISDGDPDPLEYQDVNDIPIAETKTSASYTLDGVREPVTLYLYPDDETAVQVGVNKEDGSYVYGAQIAPGETFNFEVSLPGGAAREIQFVLGQSVYSFYADPDTKRLIPTEVMFEPIDYAELDTQYQSNTLNVEGLDVEPCSFEIVEGTGTIIKNGSSVGASTTLSNGDSYYLSMRSSPDEAEQTMATVRYAGIFDSTWVITSRVVGSSQAFHAPEASSDFIDIPYAELGEEYVSDPITITLNEPLEKLSINDDYDAVLIVDGVEVGTTYPVSSDGPFSVQIKLTTKPVYGTDHQITLAMSKLSVTWVVTTLPGLDIVPLNFGSITGVTLGDLVESEEVALDLVSPRYMVSVVIPRNTRPIIDGSNWVMPTGSLNYRGVLRKDTHISVPGGSVLKLVGYALGVYGSVTQHSVRAGILQGVWSIRSIDADDAIESREMVLLSDGRESSVVSTVSALASVRGNAEAITTDAELVSVDRQAITVEDRSLIQSEPRQAIAVYDLNAAIRQRDSQIYSKSVSRSLVANGYSADRGLANAPKEVDIVRLFGKTNSSLAAVDRNDKWHKVDVNIPVTDGFDLFVKRPSGIGYYSQMMDFVRNATVHSYSVEAIFLKTNNAQYVTDSPGFERNHYDLFKTDRYEFDKWTQPDSESPDVSYVKNATVKVWYNPVYGKQKSSNAKPFVIDYSKVKNEFSSPTLDILYDVFYRTDSASFNTDYEKQASFENISNTKEYALSNFRSIPLTPIWLGVSVDIVVPNASNSEIAHDAKVDTYHSPEFVENSYNLSIDNYASCYAYQMDDRYVETSYLTHQEVLGLDANFIPFDTFTYSSPDAPPIVIREGDCLDVGNESCLDNGRFATEEDALANAIGVWGLNGAVVKTFELSEGCWVWSQIIPCANSCYDCPPSGYIRGG